MAGPRVVVVADAPGKLVDDAVAGLKKSGARVDVVSAVPVGGGDDVVALAAGPKSARALAGAAHIAHRAAFLVKAADAPAGLATVTLEAPLSSQLAWLHAAFPGRTRVIVPRSKSATSGALDAALAKAAADAGMRLVIVDVRSAGECVPAVDAALKEPGPPAVILLVADPVAVTADTVAPLVQDALAARAPVVGFSTYFLKVGALGAVAVDVAAMAAQALALAQAGGAGGAVAPDGAHLVVDGRLAERLGIAVKDAPPGVEVRR